MDKTLLVVLFALILSPFKGVSQDVSYYASVADTAQDPIVRLVALDSVMSKTHKKDDDTFTAAAITYIDLAKTIDSFELAAKKAIKVGYTLSSVKNEPRRTISIIDELLANKEKIKDSFLLGNLHLKRGGANYRLDLNQAVIDYANAIQNFSQNDSVYIADAYLFSGQAYSNLSQFAPAGENYRKAYEYFEALKDYEYMFYAQQGITVMYSMNGFLEKAMSEREKNIAKIKELELDNHLITEYYNQALDYKKVGNESKHLEYLLNAASLMNKLNSSKVDISNFMYVYARLVEHYSEINDLENAEKQLENLESGYNDTKEDLLNESQYNGAYAAYHFARGEYDISLGFALQQLKNVQALNYEDEIIDSHEFLAKLYEAQGDYKSSLENKNSSARIKDSIYNRSTANSLAYYQTLYETEKKEKELVEKNTSIQLLEKDNEGFKKLIIFTIIALVLVFGIVLLFRNQRHLKNNKILQEKFSQELLVSQEEERKRISKDLHDGLGQRLLVIKNRLITTQDDETKKMVDTTIEEVRTISRDLHPFQLQEMGITRAIEHTINQIDENTTLFISSEIDNIDNLFSPEQEVNIYRIVQESLSNVLKHAKAEAGKVSIKNIASGIVISIRDNGVGFDFSEQYQNVKSLGLKTLLERTKFLNGQMKIQSKKNNGTVLEFQFPLA